jgi:hypothetical protein
MFNRLRAWRSVAWGANNAMRIKGLRYGLRPGRGRERGNIRAKCLGYQAIRQ